MTLPGGRLFEIDHPLVMGIMNITPDSFYSGSRATSEKAIAEKVERLITEGAELIDIGACSTRPGSVPVTEEEELKRLEWAMPCVNEVLSQINISSEVLLSVDTFRSRVAAEAVEKWGVKMVNDISGGTLDNQMWATIKRLKVPYVFTHMRGTPDNMSRLTDYNNVVADVFKEMAFKIDDLRQLGVNDIIADPGFGFAKTTDQNFEILRSIKAFHALNAPLLVGMSRKSMVTGTLGCAADEALNGTTVLNTFALCSGVHILRVHDVAEARQAVSLVSKISKSKRNLNRYDIIRN